MKKHCQLNLMKNLKFISLLCFLFLGLAGCGKGVQIPEGGGGKGTNPSRSDIQDQLTAPQLSVLDNIGGNDISLFSIGSDLQLNGYQILYQVEIASDEQFSNIIYDEHVSVQEVDILGTTYYTPDFENVNWPSLTTGQTYYVRVRRVARKSGENDIVGAYSETVDFTAPDLTCFTAVPKTTSIASNQQSHVLNFSVHASGASCSSIATNFMKSHEIEIASDQGFSNIEYNDTIDVTSSSLSRNFTLSSTLDDGTYYWRVRNRIVLTNGDIIVAPYSGGVELVVGNSQ